MIIAMVNGAKTQLFFYTEILTWMFQLSFVRVKRTSFLFRLEEFQNQIKAQDYEENYHVFTAWRY